DDDMGMRKYRLSINQIIDFINNSELNVIGISHNIYIQNAHEQEMLYETAQLIYEAHSHGLLTFITINNVSSQKAAIIGADLGTDFLITNAPNSLSEIKQTIRYAGKTKIIFINQSKDHKKEITNIFDQFHSNAFGIKTTAKKTLEKTLRYFNSLNAITKKGATVKEALTYYH
ncbi:MAG: hypothetical protein ACOC1K_05915, partial [Nanoarchaeota archaeon]